MDIKLGFIGTGNMGSALLRGIVNSGTIRADNIYIYDADKKKMDIINKELGVCIANSNQELIENSDVIILAVKPNMTRTILEACKNAFDSSKMLVSIAAGIGIKTLKEVIGHNKKVIRVMPNTPALVGEGMTLVSYDENVDSKELELVKKLFQCVGKVEILDEKLMSEVIALTSSSPAYVFMFIEAMADAAVKSGISRELAYELAAQAVLGSAKMVLETGRHPGELKDQVCSPGGTTIEAVAALEKNGFRYAIIDAMKRCTAKARAIGRNADDGR
jgi:pyrroline-5-carboxylate reductase